MNIWIFFDIVFDDILYGTQRCNVQAEWGDFIVQRSDGVFAYQLAVVADDIDNEITQIVRGRDLLGATAPQLQLYTAFEQEYPRFAHIPMLLAPDRRRLSKRDKDMDLGSLRLKYPSPEVIIGRLLWLAGVLERDEPISAREAVSVFSWDLVKRQDVVVYPDLF